MYRRILVPVDGSETANRALLVALQLAAEAEGQLLLVHALDAPASSSPHGMGAHLRRLQVEEGERILARGLDIADSGEVPAETRLLKEPERRLGELVGEQARSWRADLIVIGTHGRHGLNRLLLGSGAEQVTRLAPVPVLVVPPKPARG